MTKEINEKEVELYLLDNLDFFEKKEAISDKSNHWRGQKWKYFISF